MSGNLAPFLGGCAEGRLRVQRCDACGYRQFPPRAVCLQCRSTALGWVDAPLRGTIATFTIVHRAPSEAFRAHVPYALALVDVEPGVRLMTNILDVDPAGIAIGQAVEIVFEPPPGGDAPMPMARLAAETDAPM